MTAFAASIFLFLAIVAAAVVLFSPTRRRGVGEGRLRALAAGQGETYGAQPMGADMRRHYSSIPTLRRLLTNSSWAEDVELQLQRANLQLRVGEYVLVRSLVALILFVVTVIIFRFQPVGLIVALALGGVGFLLPPLYVGWLIRRRRSKIERQLVDMIPTLSSSLRAGFAFQQAIDTASRQIGPPLAEELTLLLNDVHLGATMQSALQDLGRRVGSTDLDMLITAILVQRTTGGNLSEVLDKTSETMAERDRIRGDISTYTAQQRLTGLILSLYPAAVGLLLMAVMPHVWTKLFTETAGQIMLGIALGLQVIGFYAMRRALDIDV